MREVCTLRKPNRAAIVFWHATANPQPKRPGRFVQERWSDGQRSAVVTFIAGRVPICVDLGSEEVFRSMGLDFLAIREKWVFATKLGFFRVYHIVSEITTGGS